MNWEQVIGKTVNYGDGEGSRHQGTIVAAWLDRSNGTGAAERHRGGAEPIDPRFGEMTIRVSIHCTDNRFREAWLTNCLSGAIPRPTEAPERKKKEERR